MANLPSILGIAKAIEAVARTLQTQTLDPIQTIENFVQNCIKTRLFGFAERSQNMGHGSSTPLSRILCWRTDPDPQTWELLGPEVLNRCLLYTSDAADE